MDKHIKNLKELKRLTCQDCEMRKTGASCCVCATDNYKLCDYIVSLNFAIELLEQLNKEKI